MIAGALFIAESRCERFSRPLTQSPASRSVLHLQLIDVTYDGTVGEEVLRRLGELLPDVVGDAVDCPEEPSTGLAEPGDIEIRFRKKSPLDVGDLDVVIEVRTKLFEHRAYRHFPSGR